jgi:hypothetical protein
MSTRSDLGVIYVLSNADGSLAKIGLSRTDVPKQRAEHHIYQHGIAVARAALAIVDAGGDPRASRASD